MSSAPLRALPSLLLVLLARPAAAAPALDVVLTPPEATVGDPVEAVLTLTLDAEPAAEPRFPAWGERWGETEVREVGEVEREGGLVYRQRLVLAAFRTGDVALPPQAVAVPLAERTLQVPTPADLVLRVRSVLPAGGEQIDPRPPAPLRPLPWGERFWWSAAALSALCALAAFLLWRRRRARGERKAGTPALPPLDELLAALAALDPAAAPERLHTALSLHLRRYLGRALDFAASESTTTEIQRALLQRLPADLARRAVRLLRDCDRVKFAREEASAALAGERLRAASAAARSIEEQLRPPAPAALEATA